MWLLFNRCVILSKPLNFSKSQFLHLISTLVVGVRSWWDSLCVPFLTGSCMQLKPPRYLLVHLSEKAFHIHRLGWSSLSPSLLNPSPPAGSFPFLLLCSPSMFHGGQTVPGRTVVCSLLWMAQERLCVCAHHLPRFPASLQRLCFTCFSIALNDLANKPISFLYKVCVKMVFDWL